MNYIWAGMIFVGIVYAVLTGNIANVTDAVLDSAGEGISLCITMAGVIAFWMGLMEIAKEAGLIGKLTKAVMPVLKIYFPEIPKGHPALEYIAANVIANVLGLGWACTPTGLKAMEALAQLEAERGNAAYLENAVDINEVEKAHFPEKFPGSVIHIRIASKEMCTFLILNISSLQLLPINVIAYRSQYGSSHPAGIIGPSIAATLISTLAAVVFCKVAEKGISS